MNIHEYQAKAVLQRVRRAGLDAALPILKASTRPRRRRRSCRGPLWVVKSPDPCRRPRQGQVQGSLGRRARAASASPSRSTRSTQFAKEMLGTTLVTIQTGPAGKQVNRLYIEDGSDIEREFYLSAAGRPRHLARRPSSSPPKAAWTSRRSPTTRPRRSSPSRSIRRPASCRITAARVAQGARPHRRSRQAGRQAARRSSTRPSSRRTWRCSRSTR